MMPISHLLFMKFMAQKTEFSFKPELCIYSSNRFPIPQLALSNNLGGKGASEVFVIAGVKVPFVAFAALSALFAFLL